MRSNVCHSSEVLSSDFKANSCSQGTSCKRESYYGFLLQILPSIIIPRAKCSIAALQYGSFKGAHLRNGRRTVLLCGSVAIVSFSYTYYL